DEGAAVPAGARIRLPEEVDPLAPLFKKNGPDNPFGVPDLRGADATPQQARTMALREASREVQRMMLGWDVYGPRFEKLLEFLESELPEGLSEAFRSEMSSVRQGLIIFADVEQLFSHARHVEEGGTLGPSSNARLRVYLRRMHSEGAGIARDFM